MSAYLAINEKILQGGDQEYSGPEMAKDLAVLILACRTLIQHNGLLSAKVISSEKLVEEQMIEILQKDIEIHELKGNPA